MTVSRPTIGSTVLCACFLEVAAAEESFDAIAHGGLVMIGIDDDGVVYGL